MMDRIQFGNNAEFFWDDVRCVCNRGSIKNRWEEGGPGDLDIPEVYIECRQYQRYTEREAREQKHKWNEQQDFPAQTQSEKRHHDGKWNEHQQKSYDGCIQSSQGHGYGRYAYAFNDSCASGDGFDYLNTGCGEQCPE